MRMEGYRGVEGVSTVPAAAVGAVHEVQLASGASSPTTFCDLRSAEPGPTCALVRQAKRKRGRVREREAGYSA